MEDEISNLRRSNSVRDILRKMNEPDTVSDSKSLKVRDGVKTSLPIKVVITFNPNSRNLSTSRTLASKPVTTSELRSQIKTISTSSKASKAQTCFRN